MKFEDVEAVHVAAALRQIGEAGVPGRRRSRGHCLEFGEHHYAPKYVLGLAASTVRQRTLDPEEYSGGRETNARLRDLGFSIVACKCGGLGTPVGPASRGLRVALFVPLWGDDLYFPDAAVLRGHQVDLLVLPEAYCDDDSLATASGVLTKLAAESGSDILFGAGLDGWQTLWRISPGGEPVEVYTKHSTSKNVAFNLEEWKPDENLPILDVRGVRVGVTICHDLYLGLLPRELARRGAQVWINPSFNSTAQMEAKWRVMMKLRAIEHGIPTLCTVHDMGTKEAWATPFGFGPDGRELLGRGPDEDEARPLSESDDRNLHLVDVALDGKQARRDMKLLPPTEKRKLPQRAGDTLRTRVNAGKLEVFDGRNWVTAGDRAIKTGARRVWVTVIRGQELLDSAVFFAGLSEAHERGCRPVFWNHWERLPVDPGQLVDLLLARALENCASVILSDAERIHEVAEVASDTKSLRRRQVQSPEVDVNVQRAWGMDSAFKMVSRYMPKEFRGLALERYGSLI